MRARVSSGRQSPSPTTRGDLWRASVALALAIALALLASPMRRENATPWPSDDTRGFELGFATPQVVAPDDGMAGALVVVEDARTTANRVEVAPDALEARLTQSRQDHAVLFPDASPAVLLICAPSASAARVFDALSRVAAAGIDQVVFGFENTRASVRPLLGPVTYHALSYARVSLRTTPRATSAGVLTIDSGDTRTCDALSSRIGAARRRGQDVSLIVGAATPVSAPDAPDR